MKFCNKNKRVRERCWTKVIFAIVDDRYRYIPFYDDKYAEKSVGVGIIPVMENFITVKHI